MCFGTLCSVLLLAGSAGVWFTNPSWQLVRAWAALLLPGLCPEPVPAQPPTSPGLPHSEFHPGTPGTVVFQA